MTQENMVLYRKYRPKDFDEIIGQEHVVEGLRNSLKTGKVAHAYLFSGPRGVGKTTMARLLAKSLNCSRNSPNLPLLKGGEGGFGNIPCNLCEFCQEFNAGRSMDLIEIDAASNRGIDDIRELREGVRYIPSQGKYKTYVIDECHMLTKEAFNALLKTLEEPPTHAVFVLATTELDKVPATIVSRTQKYDFRRPNVLQIAERLKRISQKEGVKLDEDGARILALSAEGSMRDAESILGQIMAVEDKEITRETVENVLGLPRREAAKKMFEFVAKKDAPQALSLIQELSDSGYDLNYFSKILMQYFRNALFLKTDPALKRFVENEMLADEHECITANLNSFSAQDLSRGMNIIFDNMHRFKKTPIPQLPLEITVIELINGKSEDLKPFEV